MKRTSGLEQANAYTVVGRTAFVVVSVLHFHRVRLASTLNREWLRLGNQRQINPRRIQSGLCNWAP